MINKLYSMVVLLAILMVRLGARADEQSGVAVEEITKSRVAFQWGPQLNLRLPMNGSYHSRPKHGDDVNGYGIGAGLYGRILFTPKWYTASGVSFNYDAKSLILNADYNQGGIPNWHKYYLDSMVIEVPLHAGYRFPLSQDAHFSVFLGVSGSRYLAGGLSGAPSDSHRYKAFGGDGILRRSSLNGDFGGTIEIEDKALVCVEGKFGMVNIAKRDIFAYPDMYYLCVTIGVVFFL